METQQAYETQICTRCCGSGNYSYCTSYGTTCFQCRGKGKTYSKRGEAASNYARTLRTAKIEDVQVGWWLWMSDSCFGEFKTGWYEIESIEQDGSRGCSRNPETGEETWHEYIHLTTRVGGIAIHQGGTVEAISGKARLIEIRTEALAYQETLSKAGAPLKRKKVAA